VLTWYELAILGISAVSGISALCAVCITWRDFRRNSSPVLKLERCAHSGVESLYENNGKLFSEFQVRLRNQGLPLHRMTVALVFTGERGLGQFSSRLRNRSAGLEDSVFAKGMVAEFSLKSYELDKDGREFLSCLRDARKQKAKLCVYSERYLAAAFPLAGWLEELKIYWNRWAWRFNGLFDRKGADERGKPWVQTYQILPVFRTPWRDVELFTRDSARLPMAREGRDGLAGKAEKDGDGAAGAVS
jgi:hypothetical protein